MYLVGEVWGIVFISGPEPEQAAVGKSRHLPTRVLEVFQPSYVLPVEAFVTGIKNLDCLKSSLIA